MPSRDGRVAVEDQPGPQAVHLLVAGHDRAVPASFCSCRYHARSILIQLVRVGIFQRVLELRAADAIFHREVLHRLHEQGDAGDLRPASAANGESRRVALILRSSSGFEIDLDASAVQGGVGAIDADERGQAIDGRILSE